MCLQKNISTDSSLRELNSRKFFSWGKIKFYLQYLSSNKTENVR